MKRTERLDRLEASVMPDDSTSPIVIYRPGESTEEAAARQGVDPARVIFEIPDNGRNNR